MCAVTCFFSQRVGVDLTDHEPLRKQDNCSATWQTGILPPFIRGNQMCAVTACRARKPKLVFLYRLTVQRALLQLTASPPVVTTHDDDVRCLHHPSTLHRRYLETSQHHPQSTKGTTCIDIIFIPLSGNESTSPTEHDRDSAGSGHALEQCNII